MNKIIQIALGILTSIGGFLDVGAIATSAEAGSVFGFQLLWVVILGTLCVIFLVEMAGRLTAVSKHTLVTFSPTNLTVWWGLLLLTDWSLLFLRTLPNYRRVE